MWQKLVILLSLAAVLVTTGTASAALIAYWPLDGDAKDAADSHDGTLVGGASFVEDADRGTVLKVDGIDGHVAVPHSKDFEFSATSSYSIMAWAYIQAVTGTWQGIIAESRDQGDHYGIWITDTGEWMGGGWENRGSRVPTGVWVHVAYVQNGATGRATTYVNGVADWTGGTRNGTGLGDFWIGGAQLPSTEGPPHEMFGGMIDDVRVYNHALTAAEVKAMIPPKLKAYSPDPPNGSTTVTIPLLKWTKGDTAVFHDVYLGTTPELTEAERVGERLTNPMLYYLAGFVPGVTYWWRVDEIELDGTTYAGNVWTFMAQPVEAYEPQPADGATDVITGLTLTWQPGQNAISHHVYFGMDKAAVDNADTSVDQGMATGTRFDTGALRASTTYWWRVDEGKVGGSTPGSTWGFTTADGVTGKIVRQWWLGLAGTAIADLTGSPDYPNDPAGMELLDQFEGPTDWGTNYGTRMYGWLIPPESGDYTFWIASDDNSELWLSADLDPAHGVQIAGVSDWTDSREWTKFVSQKSDPVTLQAGQKYFIQALQKEGSGGDNLAVSWQGGSIAAQAIISGQYLDTFAYPPLQAFSPNPANGAVDTIQAPVLSWNAGEQAQKHEVYFGDDANAVAAADTSSGLFKGSQSGTTFDPGPLEWGRSYAWRVDETAGAEVWKGSVWSFTTANFVPIDDFESYNDEEGTDTRIYETWIDGYSDGSSGSIVGNLNPPFAERTIVHGGKQSMPMDYNNINAPFFSEAYRAFAPTLDWTVQGVNTLSLWVRGYPAPPAVNETAPGQFSVAGAGADIWGTSDQFTFIFKTLSGDGSLIARVTSTGTGTNTWAKGGVMIRDSLAGGSVHAMMVLTANSDGTAGNGASFQYRLAADGDSSNSDATSVIAAPYWVKIERVGDTITGSLSADGKNWTPQGVSQYIAMPAPAYIGLCVTSHAPGEYRTFEFDNVKATGAAGAWQAAEVGFARNSPQSLYVVVEDGSGQTATATNPDLVNAADWTEWQIPLADFAGVNLQKVKKLYIGVGDRQDAQPDGAGRIYIDDIRVTKP
jgi:hypothetical protein